MLIRMAGLDPSLNNFGMVKGWFDTDTGSFNVSDVLLSTSATDKATKKTVRKNSDDLIRAKTHYKNVTAFLEDVKVVCVEIPVGSQTSRAMASYGICIGVLSSIALPLIQVTPTEVKLAATNNKTASKADMIEWATTTHPEAEWLTRKSKGIDVFVSKNEHLADALAAIYAGIKTDQFTNALAFFN